MKSVLSLVLFLLVAASNAAKAQDDYKQTGLPVCYLSLDPDITISKGEYVKAQLVIEAPGDTTRAAVKIAGRGNSTWTRGKKPYNLKFENKVSLLGMDAGKKFALMANDYDPSKIRTAIGFAVGEWLGFEWPLHGRYVELVINGEHKGNYFLCERVAQATLGLDKKRGFILECRYIDQLDPDGVHFFTGTNNYCMEFKDPDDPDVGGGMYNYAVQAMDNLEEALTADDCHTARRWQALIDEDNFVKWYYWKNLLQMDECNRYYVVENYAEQTPLKMGPLWDFDWTIGMAMGNTHYDTPYLRNKLYYEWLGADRQFMEKVAALHLASRQMIRRNVEQFYDSLGVSLRASVLLDDKIWWHAWTLDWDYELQTDRNFFISTLHFLDRALAPYMDETGIVPVEQEQEPARKVVRDGSVYIIRNGSVYDCRGVRHNGATM